MICHHLAKFGSHRYCTSRDEILLFCHVIEQDHMIKGSDDYNGRSPSSHHPAKVGGHRHYSSGEIMVLVCHVI